MAIFFAFVAMLVVFVSIFFVLASMAVLLLVILLFVRCNICRILVNGSLIASNILRIRCNICRILVNGGLIAGNILRIRCYIGRICLDIFCIGIDGRLVVCNIRPSIKEFEKIARNMVWTMR